MGDEALTLLHGWAMNGSVFEPLLAQFESPATINCPNLPGYAGSPWADETDFELQLETMARELPAGRLLGWSLGGIYAIELASRYPQQFSRLTLIACNPCFVQQIDWRCAVAPAVLAAFGNDLMGDWQAGIRRFIALQTHGEPAAKSLARQLWRQVGSAGPPDTRSLRFGLDLLEQHDARPALAGLTQPVTLVLGARDRLVPFAIKRQITDIAPRIQVESVADAAHVPFLSHPARIAALI